MTREAFLHSLTVASAPVPPCVGLVLGALSGMGVDALMAAIIYRKTSICEYPKVQKKFLLSFY